ncbi:MAG: hypothetical protein NZ480_00200 [Bdellovibrionaceae bacterium]|nr:hypothetical protein [Pseudobdellovibrionaceae bacterium]
MDTINKVIGIDLGAKYTGVFDITWQNKDDNSVSHAYVISAEEHLKKWSQLNRRVRRHQRRSIKRRKLANRLLKLIAEKHYNLDLTFKVSEHQTLEQLLRGLLKRRGFTFLCEEIDHELFDSLPFDVRNAFPDPLKEIFCPSTGSVGVSVARFLSDDNKVTHFFDPLFLKQSKKMLKHSIEFAELTKKVTDALNITEQNEKIELESNILNYLWHFLSYLRKLKLKKNIGNAIGSNTLKK